MKLVDMLGLKPRPLMGPGSTPGTGNLVTLLYYLNKLSSLYVTFTPEYQNFWIWNLSTLLSSNNIFLYHVIFSYLMFFSLIIVFMYVYS